MSLPASINAQTAFNLGLRTPVFNITDLTPYNTEGITLNNVKGNFTIISPQGVTIYTNTSLITPDVYSFVISGITQTGGVATVTTSGSHGLVNGDIVLIGGASQSGYNVSGVVTVTGLTTFTYPINSGTASPATGTPRGLRISLNSIMIPIDGGTNLPSLGVYTITETITISGGTEAGTYSKKYIYNNTYVRPQVSIIQSVDCFIARFVSTDTTTYTVNGIYPTISRVQNITFPAASGIPVATFVTQRVQLDRPKVWNGIYITTIQSTLSYTFNDNLIILDIVNGNQAFTVSCQDICNINCCLNDANKAYINSLATAGADSPRTIGYLQVFNRAIQLADLFQLNIQCGNNADAAQNLQDILTVTGCSADCSCGSSEGEVIPYDGFIGKTILEWDVTLGNSQYDYINYNNTLYRVLVNTSAGQNPISNPTLYQQIGASESEITTIAGEITTINGSITSLANNKQDKIVVTNIYNATSGSVTILATSGLIIFPDNITPSTGQLIQITYSSYSSNPIIALYPIFNSADATAAAELIIGQYYLDSGKIKFTITTGTSGITQPYKIGYQILG